jgi:aspartate/methionine/tyrosine aminotransferase
MQVQRRAFELERAGKNIIHMEIGQPDFRAPPAILQAGADAVMNRSLGYSDALGIPELRDAISTHYLKRFGLAVDSDRIVITSGASAALLLTLAALVDTNDEVLVTDPSYPCYRHFVSLFGGVATGIPVCEKQSYQLTLHEVQKHWTERTRGVVIASPSNPTGTVMNKSELKAISEWVSTKRGFVISDEIYQELIYEGEKHSALGLGDTVFAINSFSKYFCMTGWRLGWVVIPAEFRASFEKLSQNIAICASVPAQYAALAGFGEESLRVLDSHVAEYRLRRDLVLPRLLKMGFDVPVRPSGAFYIYAGCRKFSSDSTKFASDILENAGVALTPGSDFGHFKADQFVRLAFTRSREELEIGLSRLEEFLS